MKVKVDFVTNSSSSSFVVMGAHLDIHSIPEDKLNEMIEKISEDDLTAEALLEDFQEYMDKLLQGTDLQYSFGYDYYVENAMIGICYTQMRGDETLDEFKQRVKIQIKNAFGILVEPGHIEECWMDN